MKRLPLGIYCFITVLLTSYSGYSLYIQEKELFSYIIHITKSKLYFLIFANFLLMNTLLIGKWITHILFGEIRLSEITVK